MKNVIYKRITILTILTILVIRENINIQNSLVSRPQKSIVL